MAEATLRAYLKEIDDLIEHEQLDEAIAHCRHILQIYPKHLDTYRLLGKAYLEAKRYGDAADIFQRVLSAVPDDFVAHVGMSIVREDEGNTDAAIWHMERAFETTPANPAIQQELRRLIGRRDGIEPHKVRLTRGALARMYAHGELYPQAVAELRAALQEDPERADLQVVLAEMYWRTGQRAEAVEVATKILEKLPYCREANRILAAAYQSSGRPEEASSHHRRLATLDPYAAFIETPMTDPQTVDAGSVRLDHLDWAPGQAMPLSQHEWASSLGVDLRTEGTPKPRPEPVAGPVPSWLEEPGPSRIERPAPAPTPPPEPAPAAAAAVEPPAPAPGIPGWMREAGWSESTGAAIEAPVSFSDEDISSLEGGAVPGQEAGDLAPGEIPEWLRAVAPKQAPSEEAVPEGWGDELLSAQGEGGQAPPWLEEPEAVLGAAPAPSWEPPSEEAPAATIEPEPALPEDWAAELAKGEEQIAQPGAEGEGQPLPSWLEEPAPGATDTIITWLGDRAARDTGDLAMPEWMKEGSELSEPTPEEAFPTFSAEQPAEEIPSAPAEEPAGAAPGWLAGVADAAAQQEPLQPEELAAFRERGETPAETPEGEEWPEGAAEAETPRAAHEAPDWLRGIIEPESAQPEAPAEPAAGPSWLSGTAAPRPRSFAPAPEPDWLRGLGEPSTPGEEEAEEVREAPGWLKSIQEAREPELPGGPPSPPPMARIPEPGPVGVQGDESEDWLRELGEAEAAPMEAAQAEEPPALAEAELPDWLSGLAPAAAPAGVEMPSEEELGGAFGWLEEEPAVAAPREPAEELPSLEEEPALAPAAEVSGEEDVLEWLEGLAAQQTTAVSAGLDELEAVLEEEPLVEERVLPEEPAEGLEWLERLASERGVEPEEEPVGALEPSALEEAPDWLRQATEEPFPAAEPAEAEAESALDWLGAAEEEKVVEEAPPTVPMAVPPVPREEIRVPTWLLDASKVAPVAGEPTLPPELEEALPAAYEEPAEEAIQAEVPDWLAGRVPAPGALEAEPVQPAVTPEPSWMEAVEEQGRPGAEEFEAAVPDWLRAPAEPAGAVPEPSVWEPVPPLIEPEAAPAVPAAPTAPQPLPVPARVEAAHPPPALPEAVPAPAVTEPAPTPEVIEPVVPIAPVSPPVPAVPEPALQPSPPVPEPAPAPPYIAPPAAPPVPAARPSGPPTYAPPPPVAPPAPTPVYPQPAAPQPARPPYVPPTPAYPPPVTPAYAPPQPAYQPPSPQAPAAPYWPPAPPPTYTPPPIMPPLQAPVYPATPYPAAAQPQIAHPAAPVAEPPARGKAAAALADDILKKARDAMTAGKIEESLDLYAGLIKKKRQLNAVIRDLQSAADRGSMPPAVWQALGDAYMKADRLNQAIESYRHGLEAV